jgi:hypothetical protein
MKHHLAIDESCQSLAAKNLNLLVFVFKKLINNLKKASCKVSPVHTKVTISMINKKQQHRNISTSSEINLTEDVFSTYICSLQTKSNLQ